MAKQRQVSSAFWEDPYIIARGGIEPDFRLLFLWALTNPKSELCGAYEIAIDRIMLETGLPEHRIIEGFQKFERDGKMLYREDWVIIRNFTKHQQNKSPKIQAGILNSLERAPEWAIAALKNGFGHIEIGPQQPRLIDPPSARPTPSAPTPQKNVTPKPTAPKAAATAPTNSDETDEDTEADSPIRTVSVEKVKQEIKKRMRINPKGTLPNERYWEYITRQAIGNGMTPDDVIEAYDLAVLQEWRKSPVTAKIMEEYLTPHNLDRLRDEIVDQARQKENGNGRTRQNNGTNGRRKSTVERIAEHADIISQYPTEAELRDRARADNGDA